MSSAATSSVEVEPTGEELHSLHSPTALQHLSYYACSLDIDRIDGEVIHQSIRVLADTLACALAAASNDEIRRMRKMALKHTTADAEQSANVWGTQQACAPAYAAMINSAMIRCLDANDLYIPRPPQSVLSAGHCSDAMGGVFALVDTNVNTGQQLLAATIIAYEVQVALASCMAWLERGLHSVSQINFAVPAAAAAFPQYNLTPTQLTNAMALSATTGLCAQTWLKQGFKAKKTNDSASKSAAPSTSTSAVASKSHDAVPSIKFVSVGLAAQRSIDAIELSQLGLTANADAIETMVGFFAPPDQEFQLEPFAQLGREGKSTMDRHLIKQFAAQFNLQAAIACALELYANGARASAIVSLTVDGHRYLCGANDVQGSPEAFTPQSQGSADHSTPYVIWVALEKGTFTPMSAYSQPDWLRTDVRAVLSRMTLNVVDEFEQPRVTQGRLGCRITVQLEDGRTLVASRTATSGHPDLPLSDDELLSKMSALLTPSYGPEMSNRLWNACRSLAESTDSEATKELFRLLATKPNDK